MREEEEVEAGGKVCMQSHQHTWSGQEEWEQMRWTDAVNAGDMLQEVDEETDLHW